MKIAKGEIPAARVGGSRGSIRIDKKKLDELLENQLTDLESKINGWI